MASRDHHEEEMAAPRYREYDHMYRDHDSVLRSGHVFRRSVSPPRRTPSPRRPRPSRRRRSPSPSPPRRAPSGRRRSPSPPRRAPSPPRRVRSPPRHAVRSSGPKGRGQHAQSDREMNLNSHEPAQLPFKYILPILHIRTYADYITQRISHRLMRFVSFNQLPSTTIDFKLSSSCIFIYHTCGNTNLAPDPETSGGSLVPLG